MIDFNSKMDVRAYRDLCWHDRIEILFRCRFPDSGVASIGQPIVFVPLDKAAMPYRPTPTLSLPVEAAQALMDELWGVGLRPSEGSGSAGSLAATQRHLEDMRTLVFSKSNLQTPGIPIHTPR